MSEKDLARVALERHGDAVLARLSGEIDLSGLSYLDSAGLALLSRLAGRLSELSGSLRLVVPPDAFVGRTLSISGLASAIPVDETVEAALAALARG